MKNMKKRIACLLAVLLLAAFACGAAADTRVFVDSVGREVVVDKEITRIAVSGQAAQIVVFALAPQKLVGIAGVWDDGAEKYIPEAYYDLPVLGHIYGGKGDLNLETLLSAAPQVVIDVGETKPGVGEDLDALSAQTGLPFVHIACGIDSFDRTYEMLGDLLGMEQEAKVLSDYCAAVHARTQEIAAKADKARLLYITGEKGLNVIARDSYHSQVIDMLGDNLAAVSAPSSKGTGNEVDMEQILLWNPDVIIFSSGSAYDTVGDDPLWQAVSAVSSGRYYEAPQGPYNWMGFPPSAQRLMGMTWMAKLLYPDLAEYDLYEETVRYFDLFYHHELTREEFEALTARSTGR